MANYDDVTDDSRSDDSYDSQDSADDYSGTEASARPSSKYSASENVALNQPYSPTPDHPPIRNFQPFSPSVNRGPAWAAQPSSSLYVSAGICFVWCAFVLITMVIAVILSIQNAPNIIDSFDKTTNTIAWVLDIVGCVCLIWAICVLRGRDGVSVYRGSVMLGLYFPMILFSAALALDCTIYRDMSNSLSASAIIVQVLGVTFLFFLLTIVLLGVDKGRDSDRVQTILPARGNDLEKGAWYLELELASEKLEQKEEAVSKLRQSMEIQAIEIVRLQQELSRYQDRESAFKHDNKQTIRRLDKTTRQYSRMAAFKEKYKILQDQNHSLQAEINTVNFKCEQAVTDHRTVQADMHRLVKRIKKLSKENDLFRNTGEGHSLEVLKWKELWEKEKERVQDLMDQMGVRNQANIPSSMDCSSCKLWQAKYEHLSKMQVEDIKLKEKLAIAKDEIEELRRKIRDLEDALREQSLSDKEKEHLAAKLLDLKKEHALCYDVAAEAKRNLEKYKDAEAEATALRRALDKAELKVEDLSAKNIALDHEIQRLKGELAGCQASLSFFTDTKRGEDDVKSKAYEDLKAKLAALSLEHNSLQAKYTKAIADLRELENKAGKLGRKCTELEAKCQEMQHICREHERCAEHVVEIKRLRDDLASSEQLVDVGKKELARTKKVLYKKLAELRAEIVSLEEQLGHVKGDSELRRKLVEDARARFSTLKPQLGVEFVNGDGTGIRITDVYPGKPSDAAGLKVGDIVESVNGEDTLSKSQFKIVVAKIYPGDGVPFQINRHGHIETRVVHIGTPGLTMEEILAIRRVAHGIVHEDDLRAYKMQ